MRHSTVNSHKVVESSHSMRLDADFFRPDYMEIQNKLENINSRKLTDLCVKIKHPKEIARKYVNRGTIFLRAQNVRPLHIDIIANPVFVSDEDAEILKDNSLNYEDVLLTRTGANSGQCAIYLEDTDAIASSHVFIIKSGSINPFFLTVFLNTEYGKVLINRGKYGSSQPEVAPYFLNQIPIPVLDNLPTKIEEIYLQSYDTLQLSKESFDNAIALLLAELGLTDWQPKHQPTFIKNYSDTQVANRIDAEYHQPKYDEIVNAVKGCSSGWDTLENLVSISKGLEVGRKEYLNEGIPFIRVSNLSPFEITEEKYISESLYAELKQHQPKQGEILLTKDATPGIAYYLDEIPHPMIPSSGILRLKSKTGKINNEYLTLVLNSIVVKEQVNRDAGGSIISHWRPEQVKEVVIPILSAETQIKIQQKALEAFNLKRQSKHLLECAKRVVEIAIEQDEQTAVEWLDRAALI